MQYYSTIINMKLLKNHINNDPIVDWFEIQNLRNTVYNKDKNDYFRKYILNETILYKQNFLKKFKQLILNIHPNNTIYEKTNVNETISLIKKEYPLIINPTLVSKKYNISVSVDILITKRLFKEAFKYINNVNFSNIKNTDYLIINILPEIVQFKSDKKTLQKNEIINFNECSLYVFNSALKQHTPRCDIGFIFAKGYKFKNELLDKKFNIGLVKFDDNIRWKVINSCNWIKRLKKDHYRINDIDPLPIELYPNMNYKNTEYQDEKKKIAEKIKEITMIWRISYEDRCELVKNGIKTWDNIYLIHNLYDLKDTNTKHIQEKIIHMNTQNDIIIQPRIELSNSFKEILKITDNEYILDIESLIHLEEKTNYFDNLIEKDKATVCIIGSIHLQDNINKSFKDFTINNILLEEERTIVYNWIKSLKLCTKGYVKIYHWGHAEKTYLLNLKTKYKDIIFPKLILIDLLHFFREEPIIIKNCFNFGLKNIGKAMYKHGFIKTTWTDTDNGLDAMIRFKQICELNEGKKLPLKRYTDIKEIVNYNKIDCLVLTEILQFLREKYL